MGRSTEKSGFFSVLALRDIVIFPHMVAPLFVGRDKSVQAIQAMGKSEDVVLVTQKDPLLNDPDTSSLFRVGTLGSIIQVLTLADGTIKALVRGKRRVLIKEFGSEKKFFQAKIEPFQEVIDSEDVIEPLKRALLSDFENFLKLGRTNSTDIFNAVKQIRDISQLVDTIAGNTPLRNLAFKQNLLEEPVLSKRLELLIGYMDSEIETVERFMPRQPKESIRGGPVQRNLLPCIRREQSFIQSMVNLTIFS